MILLDQNQLGIIPGLLQQALCEPAFREYAAEYLIAGEGSLALAMLLFMGVLVLWAFAEWWDKHKADKIEGKRKEQEVREC